MKAMVEGPRIVRAELARQCRRRAPVMPSRFALTLYDVSTWIVPLDRRDHLSRGGAWFRRAPVWRRYRLAPGASRLQPAQARRSVRHRFSSRAVDDHALAVSVRLREGPCRSNFRALRRPKLGIRSLSPRGAGNELALADLDAVLLFRLPAPAPGGGLRSAFTRTSTTRSSSMCCSRCSISCPFPA